MEGRLRRAASASALTLATCFMWAPRAGHADGLHTAPQRACIFDHGTLRTAPGVCRPHAIVYPRRVTGSARRAIYDSSLIFGIPYGVLLKIAQCESGLNPRASNGTHFGLFQFAPDTFHAGAGQMRHMTGISARTYWSPWDSSYVAGYLFAVGQSPGWTCEPLQRVSG